MPHTDDLPQLQEAPDASPIEHPDVLAWLAEAQRLFAEAEERFEAGRVLPALSSLAAVPPLHHMLTERFSGLLLTAEAPEPDDADLATGLYL
ncbi:MAG: hypothetical protein ACR2JF_00885 [Iamia sp.]